MSQIPPSKQGNHRPATMAGMQFDNPTLNATEIFCREFNKKHIGVNLFSLHLRVHE